MSFKSITLKLAREEENIIISDTTDSTDTSLDVSDVIEADENIEECNELNAKIEETVTTLEEADEVVDELEEQVELSDDLIENNPEAINQDTVIAAQESFAIALGKLGHDFDSMNVSRISVESATSDPVSALRLCNEGIRDSISNVVKWIEQVLKQIWEWFKSFFSKVGAILGFNKKKLEAIESKINKAEIKQEEIVINLEKNYQDNGLYGLFFVTDIDDCLEFYKSVIILSKAVCASKPLKEYLEDIKPMLKLENSLPFTILVDKDVDLEVDGKGILAFKKDVVYGLYTGHNSGYVKEYGLDRVEVKNNLDKGTKVFGINDLKDNFKKCYKMNKFSLDLIKQIEVNLKKYESATKKRLQEAKKDESAAFGQSELHKEATSRKRGYMAELAWIRVLGTVIPQSIIAYNNFCIKELSLIAKDFIGEEVKPEDTEDVTEVKA